MDLYQIMNLSISDLQFLAEPPDLPENCSFTVKEGTMTVLRDCCNSASLITCQLWAGVTVIFLVVSLVFCIWLFASKKSSLNGLFNFGIHFFYSAALHHQSCLFHGWNIYLLSSSIVCTADLSSKYIL